MTDTPDNENADGEIKKPRESAIKQRLQNSERVKDLNEEIQKSGAILKEGLQDLTTHSKGNLQTAKQGAKDNKYIMLGLVGFTVVVIGGFLYWQSTNKPRTASPAYGICKNFLELYVQYPDYLRLATVSERKPSKLGHIVRIWFSQRDSYGQKRMERMECHFAKRKTGIELSKVTIDRNSNELPKEMVEKFNAALPSIMQVETDLSIPANFPNSIQDLQLDRGRMRKRYF